MSKSKTPTSRKALVRKKKYEEGLRRCPCCNKQLLWKMYGADASAYATVDHIIAISQGGNHQIENLWVICGECNKLRGKLDFKLLKTPFITDEEKTCLYDRALICHSRVLRKSLNSEVEVKELEIHKIQKIQTKKTLRRKFRTFIDYTRFWQRIIYN